MEVLIKTDSEAVAAEAYDLVRSALSAKRDLALGLATGRTPQRLYRRLTEAQLDVAGVRFFDLDELAGLGPDDPASFHSHLHAHLLSGLQVRGDQVRFLRGDAPDLAAECRAYEEAIRACGGIDLQILGIGRNGHIAFNEPGSSLESRTRVVALEQTSIVDTATWLGPGREVPRSAVTMGVGTILEARSILVLATGSGKAPVVRDMIEGAVTVQRPASALQRHAKTTVILDEAAASGLS